MNFKDYSLEEISILLKIILEIEGNFREFHKSQFFDEFFILQNVDNSKAMSNFTNEEIFEKYLTKFNDVTVSFQKFHNIENIKEIVCFFDGNLTEILTKYEFLSKQLTLKPFPEIKYNFFLDNHCFEYDHYIKKSCIGSFPKELEHKKIKDIFSFNQQNEIVIQGSSYLMIY